MAIISKIRSNSWLLIILIGFALAAFIMMDMFSGEKSIFGGGQTTMAEIAGKKLDYKEFSIAEQTLYGNASGDVFARRNALWNYYVEKALVEKEAENLGLGVSIAELNDLEFGNKVSPIIQQRFTNPNTRQLDRERLNSFKSAIASGELEGGSRQFWAHQQKEIIKDRLQSKLGGMVTKGMYTPSWMAELAHADQNQKIDFAYVQVPFDDVDGSSIGEPSDADYQAYFNNNKGQFMQDEETRKLSYVVLDVLPTTADSAAIEKELATLVEDFKADGVNDSLFVENNYGSMDAAYLKRDQVSSAVADQVFTADLGTVIGPYLDGKAYNAVKVIDRKVIPDSVKCRHILRRASNQAEFLAATKTIDSLKTVIENGAGTFEDLAKSHSQDGSNAPKGGDLGYAFVNQMVKPFNDLIFFEAEKGKVYSVITQFGIHLVRVDDYKYLNNEEGVKLAFLRQAIVPSEETQAARYDDMLEFVGQNRTMDALQASVDANPNLNIEVSPPLLKNDFTVGALGAGQSSRDMIKWAFVADSNVGDVSPQVYTYQDPVEYYSSKYVACALKSIQPAGLPQLANIKEELRPLVINEKKAALVSGGDLSSIASKYDAKVDTAKSVTFRSAFIPGLGSEPKVVAAAFKQGVNALSNAVVGNNGVYMVQPIAKPDPGAATNIPQLKKTIGLTNQNQVRSGLMNSIKKGADIQDNRNRFF